MARVCALPTITDDRALGGAVIERSLRFNDDDSASLNRTPSSAGNRKTFTFSAWVKRSSFARGVLLGASTAVGSQENGIEFYGEIIRCYEYTGSFPFKLETNARYRDTSAWMHVVFALDTTQPSSGNRAKLYVNGEQITDFSSNVQPSQNHDTAYFNTTTEQRIGQLAGSHNFDGFMAEINFIDGQQLDPTAFGYTDSQTGIWRPKKYTGTFGNNGFNLPMDGFSHVGEDKSGNGNHFIPNDCGTVPIDRATGAFPIMNTNSGATIPRPGFKPDPFASNLVLAATFSDPIDTLDVHSDIKGSGSGKGLFVTGATKQEAIRNFYGRAGSLYFDGSSDYVDLSATTDFNFGTGDFTIEFWMYSGTNSTDGGFYRRFWMTDGPTGNAVGNFQINITPTTGVVNLWEDGSGLNLLGATNVTTSTWNHIAAVRSGSTLKLYVNGREDASTTYTTSIAPNSGTPRPRIGNYNA